MFYLYNEDLSERLNRCKKNIQTLIRNPKSNKVHLKGQFSEFIAVDDSSQTLVEYMEQSILNSDIILSISSKHSLVSAPVKKEIDFSVYKNKRIIPIFDDFKNVRDFIRVYRGVKFSNTHFNKFLNKLISIIKGGR